MRTLLLRARVTQARAAVESTSAHAHAALVKPVSMTHDRCHQDDTANHSLLYQSMKQDLRRPSLVMLNGGQRADFPATRRPSVTPK